MHDKRVNLAEKEEQKQAGARQEPRSTMADDNAKPVTTMMASSPPDKDTSVRVAVR